MKPRKMNITNIISITNKEKISNYQKKNSRFFKDDIQLNSLYLNKLYSIKQSQKMGKKSQKSQIFALNGTF